MIGETPLMSLQLGAVRRSFFSWPICAIVAVCARSARSPPQTQKESRPAAAIALCFPLWGGAGPVPSILFALRRWQPSPRPHVGTPNRIGKKRDDKNKTDPGQQKKRQKKKRQRSKRALASPRPLFLFCGAERQSEREGGKKRKQTILPVRRSSLRTRE